MNDGINRIQQGVPGGGQFAPGSHSESPVRLFDRHDGTFLKPSPSATAAHCIEFWSTVEIPDEIIEQVEREYSRVKASRVKEEMDSRMKEWTIAWQDANPKPRGDRKIEEYNERWRTEYEQHRQSIVGEVEEKHGPCHLGNYDSRQIIRACQMIVHRPNSKKFDPAETQKVLEEPIELYNEVLTVREIERKYRLSEFHYAMERVFPKSDDAVVEALAGMDSRLAGIRDELASQRSDY